VRLRAFTFPAPVERLLSETGRKGFLALTRDGELHVAHTTAQRLLAATEIGRGRVDALTIDRHGDVALLQVGNEVQRVAISNPHPEVSFHSLWQRVWYEGYSEPIFSWQSSSADDDFEPKFSLTPLAFGTLKGAFYALLFALPMAVLGAIYTAYFMAPSMRAWVKPGIEIMAALPTVILGFLAGLWLAPLVEGNLTAVFSLLFVLPLSILAVALLWHVVPERFTRNLGNGWNAAMLVLPLALAVYVTFAFAPQLETLLFGGDIKRWMKASLDIDYDQRNCLVVGVAMGLAVIPTIFSIAEDAIYSVPRHLIQGSLALGATPWQTLTRVVLLTASPGIFSAAMIGMGRAVGETMIVLMSTGNTPVMDFSVFQGMRTFAANIAVELPESAVDSTHFRVLFLAALVLFALTFTVNTAAEVVRQRLRAKYGNL
jgi:phosphate transport system permease protein